MKKSLIIFSLLLIMVLTGCNFNQNTTANSNTTRNNNESVTVSEIETKTTAHSYSLVSSDNGTYSFECIDEDYDDSYEFSVEVTGTNSIEVSDTTITFNEIEEDTIVSLAGEFVGNIIIDTKSEHEFELELSGFTLTSSSEVPIVINNECSLSAKKSTENYIYDLRGEVTSDSDISSCVYSYADLDLKGKGTLYVKSNNNNGIHTKDNLTLKNLTLQVECADNALKGNDGVKIESGTITLISENGDGIKTVNSHVSSKGKQKGDVKLQGGTITILAACDAIDSAHDVIINEDESTLDLKIYTDKYSGYSKTVTTTDSETSENVMYVKFYSTTYKYSFEYSDGTNTVFYNSSSYVSKNNAYYYPITKPSGYTKFKIYIYNSSQQQGQSDSYVARSDFLSFNDSFDTLEISSMGGSYRLGWTSYNAKSSNQGGFGPGGGQGGFPGGQDEGNSDKSDYSTKGIKADNEVNISAGTIYIKAYDDAIHTNNDTQLGEEGAYYYGTGNITISGGTIEVYSNDDGVHADGALCIKGGTISVTNSYEGLEGNKIVIDDGNVSIVSKDDGMNAVATSGAGITVNGGNIYVYAGGDGIDSNSKTSYQGFIFNGGYTVVISTSSGNSSLDTENGYTYTDGYVIAIGPSGGMSNEAKNCKDFSSYGVVKTSSLSKGVILKVSEIALIKMPTSLSAQVIVLGSTSVTLSTASTTSAELDSNGVWFNR